MVRVTLENQSNPKTREKQEATMAENQSNKFDSKDANSLASNKKRRILTSNQKMMKKADQRERESRPTNQANMDTPATFGANIMNMMAKMCYKAGTGLGKNDNGILTPIFANSRTKNTGMGYNPEPMMHIEAYMDEKPAATAAQQKEQRWSKKYRGKKKNPYTYVEELLSKNDTIMYDMRGPQLRIVTSLRILNTEDAEEKENPSPFSALKHNIRLMADRAGADYLRVHNGLQQKREGLLVMLTAQEKGREKATNEKRLLDIMVTVEGVIQCVKQCQQSGTLTLDSLLAAFRDLREQFEVEYKLWDVCSMVCGFGYPLLMQEFEGWEPLVNPRHGLEIMSSWRDFLQDDRKYTQLFGEVVLPVVEMSLMKTWQARDSEPMLQFLESWEGVIPTLALSSILEKIVMPKLLAAVESWDLREEAVPIHVWVHPWLPLLGQRLDALCHTICFKLGGELQAWQAQDESAYHMLSPWKDVFDTASWERLIARYIIPKLMIMLQEFEINPVDQKLDQFNRIMLWAPIIPVQYMVTMLEVGFFCKWHQALYLWLNLKPNFSEVGRWYMGWKDLFPQELLANERIRTLLSVGLDMMNRAVEGMEVLQPRGEGISYISEARQQAANVSHAHVDEIGDEPEMSFKDLIEAYAVEHELVFLPKVSRSYRGLPVYGFGKVSICIDSVNQIVFAFGRDGWCVVSLTQLLDLHQSAVHR